MFSLVFCLIFLHNFFFILCDCKNFLVKYDMQSRLACTKYYNVRLGKDDKVGVESCVEGELGVL